MYEIFIARNIFRGLSDIDFVVTDFNPNIPDGRILVWFSDLDDGKLFLLLERFVAEMSAPVSLVLCVVIGHDVQSVLIKTSSALRHYFQRWYAYIVLIKTI